MLLSLTGHGSFPSLFTTDGGKQHKQREKMKVSYFVLKESVSIRPTVQVFSVNNVCMVFQL